MVDILKDVITMLFTGNCYCAHIAESWDTSTRIAGNDNTRSQRRDTPYPGRLHRGRGIEYESSPQWEEEYSKWTPPASDFNILNRD